jgi:hypothetical protein
MNMWLRSTIGRPELVDFARVVGYSNVPLCGGTLPFYDVAALAIALDLDPRQVDNMLSRNTIAGVERKARGVTRRVNADAAVRVQLASELTRALGMPVGRALQLASRLTESGAEVPLGEYGLLRFDVMRLRRTTLERLDAAVEAVGRRRRGRPAGTARTEPDG